jgi:hypothetical protein
MSHDKDDFDFKDALFAAARVDGSTGAFVNQHGFIPGSEVHVPGSGIYRCRFSNPPDDVERNAVGNATIAGPSPGFITLSCMNPDLVEVRTFNAAGVPEDRDFMGTAFDLSDDDSSSSSSSSSK